MRADSSLSVAVGDEGLFPPTALVETIWEAARKIRHEIANKVDMGLHNDMNGFAQAVTNWRTQLLEESQRPRRSSWVITNLGAFDDQPALDATTASTRYQTDRDSWSITRSSFYLCANVVSSAFGIAASSVKGGGLSI
ncbi:hypothetical protein CMQ_3067 [Grosmannia clavigera kw1407]|uniref:Uncharacterized protein n=1 Tax=Grosmannia clavigera (strain kw1407 / UAMH 11150) TaxID=655863 RepID=F0XI89_GROCL|nr:uncharacterized protein CMQ_3067 [Grosmannia clavigera kw1407]EFX03138.1 hypothetical protein CMQ_3067 [Grosmannia clavigera kw1407]